MLGSNGRMPGCLPAIMPLRPIKLGPYCCQVLCGQHIRNDDHHDRFLTFGKNLEGAAIRNTM
jgi:hypothetical protein